MSKFIKIFLINFFWFYFYFHLTAFPNALTGEIYETVVGVRIPNDTSFVYDLGSGPQLFENVQVNSMSINSIAGLPEGLSGEVPF